MALVGEIETTFSSKHQYQRHAVIVMATFTGKQVLHQKILHVDLIVYSQIIDLCHSSEEDINYH